MQLLSNVVELCLSYVRRVTIVHLLELFGRLIAVVLIIEHFRIGLHHLLVQESNRRI